MAGPSLVSTAAGREADAGAHLHPIPAPSLPATTSAGAGGCVVFAAYRVTVCTPALLPPREVSRIQLPSIGLQFCFCRVRLSENRKLSRLKHFTIWVSILLIFSELVSCFSVAKNAHRRGIK